MPVPFGQQWQETHLQRDHQAAEIVGEPADIGRHQGLEGGLALARDAEHRFVGQGLGGSRAVRRLDQSFQAKEFQRGAEQIERRPDDARHEETDFARQVAIALVSVNKAAQCGEPHRFGRNERVVAIHDVPSVRNAPNSILHQNMGIRLTFSNQVFGLNRFKVSRRRPAPPPGHPQCTIPLGGRGGERAGAMESCNDFLIRFFRRAAG